MTIKTSVIRKLWANSGGFCANPNCHCDLFPFFENRVVTNIEELAHIISPKIKGPRGKSQLSYTQRDDYDNIIILCPNCHTTVDKNPHLFPATTLLDWKANHETSIKNLFQILKFLTKSDLRKHLTPILEENKSIFKTYGPNSLAAQKDPMSSGLNWERLSIQKILPNNRTIEKVIDANLKFLTEAERNIFYNFKIHREGFEFNKLSGDVNPSVTPFPTDFDKILL